MENEEKVNVEETQIEEPTKKKHTKQVKGKGLTVFIIVIVLIALAITYGCGLLLGKELYDKKENNEPTLVEEKNEEPDETTPIDEQEQEDGTKEDKPKEDEPKEDEPKEDEPKEGTEVQMSSEEISAIMERFNGIKISHERLFEKDKFNINNINTNEMLATALSKMYIYNACSKQGRNTISLSDINESLSKYVKKDLTFNDIKNIDSVTMGLPYDIAYSFKAKSEKEIDVIDSVCGGTFGGDDYIYGKTVKVEKSGEYAYIYEKIAFARYGNLSEGTNGEMKVNYYKDYKKTGNIIETLNSKEFLDNKGDPLENSTPNWDLYNSYKYTFKLIDGSYYFQSFELVK